MDLSMSVSSVIITPGILTTSLKSKILAIDSSLRSTVICLVSLVLLEAKFYCLVFLNWPGKKSRFELSNMMRNLMSFRVTTKGPGPPTLESRGDHDIWSRRERHGHCGALTQTVVSPTQRSPLQLQGCECCNFGSEERE